MQPEKSVFYGTGAYVNRYDDETRIWFWTSDPRDTNFDPSLLVPVDLAKDVSAARAGKISWKNVVVDAPFAVGGLTSVGPLFPEGPFQGAVYLEEHYWQRLRKEIRPPMPPLKYEARAYEFMAVVYHPGTKNVRAGKRYFGYHAIIVEEHGDEAKVEIFHGGSSIAKEKIHKPAVVAKVKLDSLDFDANESGGGLTQIALGAGKPKEGALFIEARASQKAFGVRLYSPKQPPGDEEGVYPVVDGDSRRPPHGERHERE